MQEVITATNRLSDYTFEEIGTGYEEKPESMLIGFAAMSNRC